MRSGITFLFIVLSANLLSQAGFYGIVSADNTKKPLDSVIVLASGGDSSYIAVSDPSGGFNLSLKPGIYSLFLSRNGYYSLVQNEISVYSGKQLLFDFELKERKISLDTVTILPKRVKELDLRNLQQYAAVFYDPARVINSRAAAINTNDQGNSISVHGTSPAYLQWKAEGVEIVNPNHLENSGTLNDRPSLNGGGVSILSAQVLHNSDFQFAPFDPLSGNALSGIFDMRLRRGNEKQQERTVQVSFLGTDLAVEGPFSSKSKASYLVNARYSTIGLLSTLGVNFGDEKTNFKDISYVFNFPFKRTTIKFFGMAGTSETLYKGKKDTAQIELQKELQDIRYTSFTTINGLSGVTSLGNTVYLKAVAAYSSKLIRRNAVGSSSWDVPIETDDYDQRKLSSVIYLSKRISNSLTLKSGSYFNYFTTSIYSVVDALFFVNAQQRTTLLQPFVSAEGSVFKNVEFKIGLHSMYIQQPSDFNLQPRAMLKFVFSADQDLALTYGRSSQLQPAFLSLGNAENKDLKPTRSDALSFQHRLDLHILALKSELFYQWFENIPEQTTSGFSGFNYFNEHINFKLDGNGKAKVYGLDLSAEKRYNGFYGVVSGSIFESLYRMNRDTYKGRYSTGYNCFVTSGKEWRLRNKKKYISFDLRGTIRNGFREPMTSSTAGRYYYNTQLPYYKRIDIRLSYRNDRKNSTTIWALDVQNIANFKNVAYTYYDSVTSKVETKYQLGLIPVLSYKILF